MNAARETMDVHELAICQALMDQVNAIAREHDAIGVSSVTVRVGPLSGVEPELLERAFEIARAGSVAGEASLVLETEPVRIHCHACGVEHRVVQNRLRCPDCPEAATTITSGDALTLASVALERRTTSSEPNQPEGAEHV